MELPQNLEDVKTIPELFFFAVRERADADALRTKEDGEWKAVTYAQWGEVVRTLAAAMADWIEPGDTICLVAENRREWTYVDLAAQSLAGILAPIYPTSPPKDVAYIINDAAAKVVVVSSQDQLDRVLALKADGEIDRVERIVVMDDVPSPGDGVQTLAQLLAEGKGKDSSVVDERCKTLDPEAMASLIYTSGTTGNPKGVMLSHRNFISNVHAGFNRVGEEKFRDTMFLSFLPLSHSLERTCGYYMALRVGGTISYAESIEKLVQNLGEVKPTVLISVPRIYEKVYASVLANASSGIKKVIFDWALGVGRAKAFADAENKPVPLYAKMCYPLAYKLVFSKLNEKLGGRLEFTVSGGAPLSKEIAIFLKAAGLTVLEGYGLTETAPILTINGPEWTRFGAVGQALEDIELKIDPEPDAEREGEGEIMARGPNVMLGYYNKPDATAEVLDGDGWFRTGDIGYIDDDGFVFITDRKKELLKTSGGKYVAPAPIENQLKLSPVIEQACVIGNRRKFCTALLFPDVAALASRLGTELPADTAKLADMPEVLSALETEIKKANEGLGKWESIKKFAILPRELSVEDGELTPTLKMKRRKIDEHFKDLIDGLYPGDVV
jgi:long-chain acyl-CoA synthetase